MTNAASETQGTVVLEMSMSLDGFIAGTDIGEARPMGDEGEQLHDWMFRDKTETEARASQEQSFEDVGAVVIGRRTFDLGVGPWGDNPAFHAPCFVISREAQPTINREGGSSYIFVTGGAKRAGAEDRAAAGNDLVQVMGGAGAAQQGLRAGLIDELRIHLVPLLLGAGTRLFERLGTEPAELELIGVTSSPAVAHLRLRVIR